MKDMEECSTGQEAPIEDGTKKFWGGFEKLCWGKTKTTRRKNRRQV